MTLYAHMQAASMALRYVRWTLRQPSLRGDVLQAMRCGAAEGYVRGLDARETRACASRWIQRTLRDLGMIRSDSSRARIQAGKSKPRKGFGAPPARCGRIELPGHEYRDDRRPADTLIGFVAGFVAAHHGAGAAQIIHLVAEGGIARLPREYRTTARIAVEIWRQS